MQVIRALFNYDAFGLMDQNWIAIGPRSRREDAMIDPGRVESREDFVAFMEALRRDFGGSGDGWSNVTIPDLLEAIAAWAESADYAASPEGWRVAAVVLWIGRIYD